MIKYDDTCVSHFSGCVRTEPAQLNRLLTGGVPNPRDRRKDRYQLLRLGLKRSACHVSGLGHREGGGGDRSPV